ncbi:condensation domain-containing protein, partial [Streptomyces colonosanans]|uniref:condensation domain-containing protein n=1 Tax=Streptomyces colonosanans TaxID=1428652 RepID=UPI00115FBEDE
RALFEAPSVMMLGERLAGAEGARAALVPVVRPEVVPLSFAQRRLWFLNRFEGTEASTYNMPIALRLTGVLDREALTAALLDVVGRHESLRTVFPESADGTPCQRVLGVHEVAFDLPVVDISEDGLPAALAEAAGYGFDLLVHVPIRACLFAVNTQTHVLVVVLHHIAGDGWSMAPLARDVATAYAARCEGTAPQWTTLPVQYADYTLWQRELLGDESDPTSVLSQQVAYWTEALADLPEQLELPFDRPRPVAVTFRGENVPIAIDTELHRRIAELALESGVSVFMVVQAAFAALLSRLGAGTDIPIGTPVAGRTDEALDDLVGFFVNTLVLRTDLSGNPTFRELIDQVRETDLAAFAHQDVPFEHLVEVINPARSMSRHPLFQVMLAFQNNEQAEMSLPGLTLADEPAEWGAAKFDLSLSLREQLGVDGLPGGLVGSFEFALDVFDRVTVERLAGWFERLLTVVVDEADTPVGEINVLSAKEHHRLVNEWNDTVVDVPWVPLPVLFEEQVRRSPDAVAVVFEDAEVSYAKLNAWANRLARLLIERGAGPERVVALMLPRSVELIVGLLAIVKTGAAYLPVDPEFPADRIAFMLGDADAVCVLASAETVGVVPTGVSSVVLDDTGFAGVVARFGDGDVSVGERGGVLLAGHPVYVMYTSGSTGLPKGVVFLAGALANLLAWHGRVMPAGPSARTGQFAALGFDAAAQEIFSALWSGKTLVVPRDEVRRSPVELVRWFDRFGVGELFAPNPMVEAVVEAAAELGVSLPCLRDVAQAGEALSVHGAVQEFFATVPDRRLHNYYGPTESHVVTAATLEGDAKKWPLFPSIGRPVANSR